MRNNIPKAVLVSVAILLGTHAMGLWQMVQLSRTLGVPLWMPYSTLAFFYSLLIALLVMILLGKRWARTTYTVLGGLSIFLTVFGHLTEIGVAGWLVLVLKVAAIWLLYAATSDLWFNGSSPNNSFKPNPHRGGA